MAPQVVLVMGKEEPGLIADDIFLLQALSRLGAETLVLDWEDMSVDWTAHTHSAVLIRSLWEYAHEGRFGDFTRFIGHLQQARCKPAADLSGLLWSCHKRFLLELQKNGVPTVPTELVVQGAHWGDVRAAMRRRGWACCVCKPCLGSRGDGVERVGVPPPDDGDSRGQRTDYQGAMQAAASIERQLKDGDMLLQVQMRSTRALVVCVCAGNCWRVCANGTLC